MSPVVDHVDIEPESFMSHSRLADAMEHNLTEINLEVEFHPQSAPLLVAEFRKCRAWVAEAENVRRELLY